MLQSAYSTQVTSTSNANSTKGFLSFSSQSVIESSKGPSLMERFKANCLHISTNMHRYKGFGKSWHNFAVVFRMLQNYAIFLMPGCTSFWNKDNSSSIFITIFTITIHFCFAPGNMTYHSILEIFLFLFYFVTTVLLGRVFVRDISNYSMPNGLVEYICILFSVLTPIFSIFVSSLLGTLLKGVVFNGNRDPLVYVGIALGAITTVAVIFYHYFSFFLIRSSPTVRFDKLFSPWTPFAGQYAHTETYFIFLAFCEEFLPLNNQYYLLGFSIACIIIANPIHIWYCLYKPIFQDINDCAYYATQLTFGFVSSILMNVQFISKELTATILFIVCIIFFVIFLFVYRFIAKRIISKSIKSLYSVYKQSEAVLPATTPLVFTSPLSNQVALSHEAYSVMQAFNSLEITKARKFQIYMAAGALLRMPALRNIDFIKWGLNYFTDPSTLIICAQICQYFEDSGQTLPVLLQKLREAPDMSLYMHAAINTLDLDHTDIVSDKPLFLKLLEKKANGGLARCRRALALFWGCVLKHSQPAMKESLCRLRDAISNADKHFDELMRCYPTSLQAIGLYMSYLTEVKGDFTFTNQYINEMSSLFIEMKSDAIEDDESVDGISLLLQDPNRTFSPYISKLSSFLEQERQSQENTKGPIIALWTLAIVSIIVIIACIVFVIIETLVNFKKYPLLLNIVNSGNDVIIEMTSLIIGCRRLCLFSAGGLKQPTIDFGSGGSDTSMYDSPEVLIPYLLEHAEVLPQIIGKFYRNAMYSTQMVNALNFNTKEIDLFGERQNASLSFMFDMMCMSIRNIATNIPSLFKDYQVVSSASVLKAIERIRNSYPNKGSYNKYGFNKFRNHSFQTGLSEVEPIEDYASVCQSEELSFLMKNVQVVSDLTDDFVNSFIKLSRSSVDSLDNILYWTMIMLPIAYIVFFCTALAFICMYTLKESNFRLTLFLSLPEQVASEIFRSGGGSGSKKKKGLDKKEATLCEISPQSTNKTGSTFNHVTNELLTQEGEIMKEKALTIESLEQFSASEALITGTGIKQYIGWCIVYIIIAAITIFSLTYYARDINSTFHARSLLLCDSALRYSSTSYASMFLQEGFFNSSIALFTNAEIQSICQEFLDTANLYHRVLTFGNGEIPFDFREYQGIKDIIFKDLSIVVPEEYDIEKASSSIQHDGYRYLGFDSQIRLLLESSTAILETFKKNSTYYKINDFTWQQFNHLQVGHVEKYLIESTNIYLSGVNDVINKSFIVALIISIVLLIVLLIVFAGPIVQSIIALSRFFTIGLHVLCQVPPDVFARSLYINKWLKGHISRSNYRQYETTFNRTVSPQLQSRIIDESLEKLLLFNSNGQYIETSSYDVSSVEEKTVRNILTIVIDQSKSPKTIDDVERAVEKLKEAKDATDNIIVLAQSKQGTPLKLTITGITSSDSSLSNISSVQKFYSFIAILIRDITQESNEQDQYEQQKEHTMRLLKSVIPTSFAIRMHDGERRISFSSGIGTVMTMQIHNYELTFDGVDPAIISEILVYIRHAVNECLAQFENVSLISFRNGKSVFVAGLFNDEQNGRTEAIDTIQFALKLNASLKDIAQQSQLDIELKYGVCTGGPIYCKLLMDGSPISLVSGEIVSLSNQLLNYCKPKQLLLERTTYECIYGLNVDAQLAGEIDFNGKHTPFYSVPINHAMTQ